MALVLGYEPGRENIPSRVFPATPSWFAIYPFQETGCRCRQQEPDGGRSPGRLCATCPTSPVCASTPAQTTRQGPNIWPGAEAPIYQLIFTFGLPMGCIHTNGNRTDSLTPMLLVVRGGGFPLIRYTNNDYWRCVPRLQSLQAVPEDQRPRQGPGRGAGLTVRALL